MVSGLKLGAAAAAAIMVLSGCVREAEIAMPSDVRASLERIELTGMGGGGRGDFLLGRSGGRFTRGASQASYLGGGIASWGGGSFIVEGSDFGRDLVGNCGFDQHELDIGAVVLTTEHMLYACEFRQETGQIGHMVLREVPTSGGLLAGRTRAGELEYGNARIRIRAIHDMEGGILPSGTPLGYAFEAGGRQIGAVDLNGGNKTIYAPHSGVEREAVLAASLALSVFWDPGD